MDLRFFLVWGVFTGLIGLSRFPHWLVAQLDCCACAEKVDSKEKKRDRMDPEEGVFGGVIGCEGQAHQEDKHGGHEHVVGVSCRVLKVDALIDQVRDDEEGGLRRDAANRIGNGE